MKRIWRFLISFTYDQTNFMGLFLVQLLFVHGLILFSDAETLWWNAEFYKLMIGVYSVWNILILIDLFDINKPYK